MLPTILLLLISLLILAVSIKAYHKKMHIWFPYYLVQKIRNREKPKLDEPIHIMFCIVDHFEPGTGGVSPEQERKRVDTWVERYPRLAAKHRDADSKPPQHTWFFPPHYHRQNHLARLVELCGQGFGEIEMHLHHDRLPPYVDTSETLRKKIEDCIAEYSKFGIFGQKDGRPAYAFIHGSWALDNSRSGKYCGVNNELQILNETGCYADFTFPCSNEAQPRMANTIYYASDDPDKPKSYDRGTPVSVGGNETGDIMIIQGPLGLRWKSRTHKLHPTIEATEIDHTNLPTEERIDFWVRNGLRIRGQPNWIFVKLHCHGAPEIDHKVLLDNPANQMYSYLESRYNDGQKYSLHYVTAREMYNIIKAAEASETGNPNLYRNYLISSPLNTSTGKC